jgi:alpha-glucosidase
MDNRQPLTPAIEGGTTIRDFDAHIDASSDHIGFHVPMYVRGGAIIPTLELEQYVGERHANNQPNPITLNLYPGECGQYTMYLDDGVSRSSAPDDLPQYREDDQAKGEYRETQITHSYVDSSLKTREIKVERIHDQYTPKFEDYFFIAVLHGPTEPTGNSGLLKRITIGGQEVHLIADGSPEQRAVDLNASTNTACYYNENIKVSFIKVFDNKPLISLTAEYV